MKYYISVLWAVKQVLLACTRCGSERKVLETVKDILAKTIKHDGEVFGASEIECGNYKTLNLDCAKKACREHLEAIRDINDIITYDDVNQRGC